MALLCVWWRSALSRQTSKTLNVTSGDIGEGACVSVFDLNKQFGYVQLYVLETWRKRGAELSADHYIVVGWMRWWGSMLDENGLAGYSWHT